MKISTKSGDHIYTSSITSRVPKDDSLIESLGTLDELQASLMLASHYVRREGIRNDLHRLVQELFLLGQDLLQYEEVNHITKENLKQIESNIDAYEQMLPDQTSFILPGNNLPGSYLHLARTIARRLERRIISLGRKQDINPVIFAYINRISDLLYIYARTEEEL
ncbi:MAG: cob(I)yrinic acid a,c-diamide adenosyltransferase [Acholeplasmataceae bacterium]|nr:cob(I)yrinic acid a,c-diamide adenosyltransferase [Acholeplasmataceae bacterium]